MIGTAKPRAKPRAKPKAARTARSKTGGAKRKTPAKRKK